MEHVSNVKYILPAEKYIEQFPEYDAQRLTWGSTGDRLRESLLEV